MKRDEHEPESGMAKGVRIGVGLAVLAGCVFGGAELWRLAKESERFALRKLEASGLERVAQASLQAKLAPFMGENLLVLDLDAVASSLESLSWVDRVELSRRLPDGLRIDVTEHEAVALVSLGELYDVDAAGEIFRAHLPDEPVDLPVITGVSRESWERGALEAGARVRGALDLVALWPKVLGAKAALPAEIDVGAVGLVRYRTADGLTVELGPAPWDEALKDAERALLALGAEAETIETLYVGRGRRRGRVTFQPKAPATERETEHE